MGMIFQAITRKNGYPILDGPLPSFYKADGTLFDIHDVKDALDRLTGPCREELRCPRCTFLEKTTGQATSDLPGHEHSSLGNIAAFIHSYDPEHVSKFKLESYNKLPRGKNIAGETHKPVDFLVRQSLSGRPTSAKIWLRSWQDRLAEIDPEEYERITNGTGFSSVPLGRETPPPVKPESTELKGYPKFLSRIKQMPQIF